MVTSSLKPKHLVGSCVHVADDDRFGVPSAVKSSGVLAPTSSNSGAFSVREISYSLFKDTLITGEMGDWGAPPSVLLPHGLRSAGHGLHKQSPRMLLSGPQCWRVWRSQ